MHLLDRYAVDPGLGLGQRRKNRKRTLANGLSQVGRLENIADLAIVPSSASLSMRPVVMAMLMVVVVVVVVVVVMTGVFAGYANAKISGRKRAARDMTHLEFVFNTQPRQIRLEFLLRKPKIKKSRSEHISSNAGKEIQMKDLLRRLSKLIRVG